MVLIRAPWLVPLEFANGGRRNVMTGEQPVSVQKAEALRVRNTMNSHRVVRDHQGFCGATHAPRRVAACLAIAVFAVTVYAGESSPHKEGRAAPTQVTLKMAGTPKNVTADKEMDPSVWRTGQLCGANSVYLVLKLLSPHPPEYEVIRQELPSRDEGTSIVEMRQVLNEHGVAADILRAAPRDLELHHGPVIAHWQQEIEKPGHYVVVLETSTDGMRIVDGTTGSMSVIPRADFLRLWSGVLLVPRQEQQLWAWLGAFAGGILVAIVYFAVRSRRAATVSAAACPVTILPGHRECEARTGKEADPLLQAIE
jgi:hypothetical protein